MSFPKAVDIYEKIYKPNQKIEKIPKYIKTNSYLKINLHYA